MQNKDLKKFEKMCFERFGVPAKATYKDGKIHIRFTCVQDKVSKFFKTIQRFKEASARKGWVLELTKSGIEEGLITSIECEFYEKEEVKQSDSSN